MECLKWQEVGLLFVSGETDVRQNEELKEHMKVCAECKNEVDQYYFEKKKFFSHDLLAEAPPKAIDAKIITACSQKPVMTTGFNLFSGLWMKKALLSTFFLVFGMGAGVYFTVHYFSSDTGGVAISKPAKTLEMGVIATNQKGSMAGQAMQTKSDSAANAKKDSLKSNNAAAFPSGRKSSEGIITVDVKKE
jgi:hypothetical protein